MPRPKKTPDTETTAPDPAQVTLTEAVEQVIPPKAKAAPAASQPLTMRQAFVKFQQEVPTITKDGKGNYGQYVTLDELIGKARPILNRLGFVLTQDVYTDADGYTNIITTLIHESGEALVSGSMRLSFEGAGMQKLGSAITYGRRYQLGAFLGLATDIDDDGQSAQDTTEAAAKDNAAKIDKEKQKYIQYINAISQKLGLDIDPSIYTAVTLSELIETAKELKEKLNAQGA